MLGSVVQAFVREFEMGTVPEFHSASPEDPPVWHDQSDCYEGKKILPQNKRDGRGGKRRCEVCDSLSR